MPRPLQLQWLGLPAGLAFCFVMPVLLLVLIKAWFKHVSQVRMGFACTDTETLELGTAAATVCAKLSLLDDLATGVNVMFLLFAGALVFIMHAGFAMLCAGAIRSKNTMNILLQTILDAASSAVAFYVLG